MDRKGVFRHRFAELTGGGYLGGRNAVSATLGLGEAERIVQVPENPPNGTQRPLSSTRMGNGHLVGRAGASLRRSQTCSRGRLYPATVKAMQRGGSA